MPRRSRRRCTNGGRGLGRRISLGRVYEKHVCLGGVHGECGHDGRLRFILRELTRVFQRRVRRAGLGLRELARTAQRRVPVVARQSHRRHPKR